jgi:polyketide cyclase/dehydrase/lipid transport protein
MTIVVVEAGKRKISRSADIQAPAAELFEIVADPRRHPELDGSGTVIDMVSGPARLARGAKFSVKMKQYGFPYRITSRVTEFDDGHVVEWQHPAGHRWRWEFDQRSEHMTQVTETFDYSGITTVHATVLDRLGVPKKNAAGIEATLQQLQDHYRDGLPPAQSQG